jgi:hypothetical protein
MQSTNENDRPGVYIIGRATKNFHEKAMKHTDNDNDDRIQIKRGTLIYQQEGYTTYFLGGAVLTQEQLDFHAMNGNVSIIKEDGEEDVDALDFTPQELNFGEAMLRSVPQAFIRHMNLDVEIFVEAFWDYLSFMKWLRGSVSMSIDEFNGLLFGLTMESKARENRSITFADLSVSIAQSPPKSNKRDDSKDTN